MASKHRCCCCAENFLGVRVPTCNRCKLPCCATCKNNGSQSGTCCKCSGESCARTSGGNYSGSTCDDDAQSSAGSSSVGDASLQDGFEHPVFSYGRRYAGVGPNGPPLSFFQRDPRWSFEPFQKFVKHVVKHLPSSKQLTEEDYAGSATYVTDYSIDVPGWTGMKWEGKFEHSYHPFPNYRQPEPVAAFQQRVDLPKGTTLDPPDTLREIPAAVGADPMSYFCYDQFWAAGPTEDPRKYPHAFATLGSSGIHFFNHNHHMVKEYKPSDHISAAVADSASESWLYLHQDARRVTVGSLDDPEDIVMEFDLLQDFYPQAIGIINTLNGRQALIQGAIKGRHTVKLYDLSEGKLVSSTPIQRYDFETKYPLISRGVLQTALCMDPVRPNVCYMGLQSEHSFAVIDTRMNYAARWVHLDLDIRHLTVQTYGNCDKLAFTNGADLTMYDLTAGKCRFRHSTLGASKTDFALFGLASFGEQMVLGRCGAGGSAPIVSYVSWEHFESGTYHDTKKDPSIPGSGGQFLAANSSGIFVMEHNHAQFGAWQQPLGSPLISQVKGVSATASGAAPAQKGVRRAKREQTTDSFGTPVNAPTPNKPTGYTEEFIDWQGLPSVAAVDRNYFNAQLWVATGNDNPDAYPFSVMCAGDGGVNVFDHYYNFMGNMLADTEAWYYGATAVAADPKFQMVAVCGKNKNIGLFDFTGMFNGRPRSLIPDTGVELNAVAFLDRSSPQLVVGGDEVMIFDIASGRRISSVAVEHAGCRQSCFGLKPDRYRPDVLYIQGSEQGFVVDFRVDANKVVRSLAPANSTWLRGMVVADYGAANKAVLTQDNYMASFDLGTGAIIQSVNGEGYGAAANFGSLLCIANGEHGVSYYDMDNLTAQPFKISTMHGWNSADRHCIGANHRGAFRKAGERLYFYPFQGTMRV